MDNNHYQDEFESFLQEQANSHRMYPSDAVWRNINKELHGDKKWPALTIAALALFVATVSVCVYFVPKPSVFTIQPNLTVAETKTAGKSSTDISSSVPFLSKKPGNLLVTIEESTTTTKEENNTTEAPTQTSTNTTDVVNVEDVPLIKLIGNKIVSHSISNSIVTEEISDPVEELLNTVETTAAQKTTEVTAKTTEETTAKKTVEKDFDDRNMVDEYLNQHKDVLPLITKKENQSTKNNFSYQVYVSPTISYRQLKEDRSALQNVTGGPVALNYISDVNHVVRHKPGQGMEVGMALMYNMSEKLKVKTGLQFNVRQYSIEAFMANSEVAPITLITPGGINYINSISTYRTNNGYFATELINRYYQISVPLGLDVELMGNRNVQLNVAASVQPTYLINRNAYLLSTNYKNYTENPDMLKSWNINSNIEAYFSFSAKDFKIQLGPQLRYQHLQSFIPQYPIKEHLVDYGVKLGVIKTIK